MRCKLLLYQFIHGFHSTLFRLEQHCFHIDRQFSCSPNISNWLSWVPTQSSLVIQNSCSSDYPVLYQFVLILLWKFPLQPCYNYPVCIDWEHQGFFKILYTTFWMKMYFQSCKMSYWYLIKPQPPSYLLWEGHCKYHKKRFIQPLFPSWFGSS